MSTALAVGLWCLLEFTEFGAKLRASVDNPRMARCVGINVPRGLPLPLSAAAYLRRSVGFLAASCFHWNPGMPCVVSPVLMVVAVGGLRQPERFVLSPP